MRKFYLLLGYLLLLIMIARLFPFSSFAAIAQQPVASSDMSWKSVLDTIFQRKEPKDRSSGGRGVARNLPTDPYNIYTSPALIQPIPNSPSVCVLAPKSLISSKGKDDPGIRVVNIPSIHNSENLPNITLDVHLSTHNLGASYKGTIYPIIEGTFPITESTFESGTTIIGTPSTQFARTASIWSTRPLFVWQGTPSSIAVQIAGKNSVLRQATSFKKSPLGLNYVLHSGEPLQPGQSYQLLFFDSKTQQLVSRYLFKLMDVSDRAAITRDLQDLEKTLRKTNVTKEAISLQRANYFARRDMLADMLQEMYSVENPSDELKKALRETQAEICP